MNLMNPITNEQMALKYIHVCLFKPVFYQCQSYMILGPEHGKMSFIQIY